MKVIVTAIAALLVNTVTATPVARSENNYLFKPVNAATGFSIKVPSELFIVMCENADFTGTCDGGYVSPGLCYYPPSFGVTAVRPAQDISGCTLYKSDSCDSSEDHLNDVAWPGIPNLTSYGLNDAINSFICY